MFYGGNNATILDAQLNEYNKAKVVLTGLINLEKSHATKARNRNMFKNDTNTEMPYILKGSPNMSQNTTYKDFDFTYASTTSNVFEQFSNSTIELSYAQLFNLVSNMQYVNGGRKWVESKMDFKGTYKAEDYAVLSNIPYYNYLPETIASFDPSLVGKVHNVLSLRANIPNEIELIQSIEKEDVEVVSDRFLSQFEDAKRSFKRISLCYAVAGLGKSEVIIREPNVIIAVPNHKLKNELAERMKSKGLDYVITPEVPVFECEALNTKYKELQDIEETESASSLLHDIAKGTKIEGIEYGENDIEVAAEYYSELQIAYNAEVTVLTTHARIMLAPRLFKNKGTVIIDENIIGELVKTKSADYASIHDSIYRVLNNNGLGNDSRYYLESVKAKLEGAIDNKELSLNIGDSFTKSELLEFLQFKNGCASLKALIGAEKIFKSVYKGVVSYNYGSIKQFDSAFDKVIVVSADIKESTYKRVLDESFNFFHSGFVKNKLPIVQYNDKSYSKSYMNSEKFTVPDYKHDVIITYKSMREKFSPVRPHYYGNLIGLDLYKGEDISLIGTPIPPSGATIIKALLLGYQVSDTQKGMQVAESEHFKFPFFTFNDEVLRAIELEDIERELVQALGRGRTIRTESNTELFSSFPLVEADVQKGKRYIENVKTSKIITNTTANIGTQLSINI